jgi:predicted anti-sigma-YlaC factor YlaD
MTRPYRDPSPSCASVTEAISARMDGEPPPLSFVEVSRHLTGCAACRRFESAAVEVTEHSRSLTATAAPDLAPTILAALHQDRHSRELRRTLELRWLVAVAGAVQLVLGLVGTAGAELHVGRDLGALQLALGVGLVLAAWQPQRSAGVLPIAAVVAVAAVTAATIDVATGGASAGAELTHLAEVVGVLALWGLRRRVPSGPPSLRAVITST